MNLVRSASFRSLRRAPAILSLLLGASWLHAQPAPSLHAADVAQRAALVKVIAAGSANEPARALLAAIAQDSDPPAWTLAPLLEASKHAADADIPALARALSSHRSRDAAAALLDLLPRATSLDARDALFDGLERLTGRTDLSRDSQVWSAWLAQAQSWDELRWQTELARAQADRADRTDVARDQAAARLVESLRRIHLATRPEDRPAFLSALLSDPLDDVRRLGIELASRELAEGNRLDNAVANAALDLLASHSASLRAQAAELVNQLAPEAGEARALAALARETDPSAAASLLRLSTRWPSPRALPIAMAWLDRGGPVRDAAIEALRGLERAGLLVNDDDRVRTLRAVRDVPLNQLSPAGCWLRAVLGTTWDHEQIASLLRSPQADVRLAAAQAVVDDPVHLDSIIAAAAVDPALIDAAVTGVYLFRQTAAGFKAIAVATAGKPEIRRSALVRVADVLEAPDLLAASRTLTDEPALREAILALFADGDRIMSERADPTNARAIEAGLIELARLRLTLKRPADAVAALDALATLDPTATSPANALRLQALFELGRFDRPEVTRASVQDWLVALQALNDRAQALAALTAFSDRFSGSLPTDAATALERIKLRWASEPAVADGQKSADERP